MSAAPVASHGNQAGRGTVRRGWRQAQELGEDTVVEPTEDSGRRRYENPPIEEALCEFQFVPGKDEWDLTMPGLIYERLRHDYPEKPRTQLVGSIQVAAQPEGSAIEVQQREGRVQLVGDGGRHLVSIGPNVISVHMLRPYSQWEDLRQRLRTAIAAYESVAKPSGITRIGVRYVNKIVVEGESVDLTEYFTATPTPPKQLPQVLASFIMRWESRYPDMPARLVTTFASLNEAENSNAFILDIDVIGEWSNAPISTREALDFSDELRRRERVAFEALIKDKAREMFVEMEV